MTSVSETQLNKMVRIRVKKDMIELVFLKSPESFRKEAPLSHFVSDKVKNILDEGGTKKFTLLVNLLKIGESGSPPAEARKVYAKMGSDVRLKKVAVCGDSVRLKVVSNFIARLTKRSEFHWFDTLAEAKKWLQK